MSRADLCSLDAISLSFHKEMAKEKEPKGLIPFGNPQSLLLWLSFGGYQKALSHLQALRNKIQRCCCYCKQAKIFHFTPLSRYTRDRNESRDFCLEVNANFFNSHSQALNLLTFAPQSGEIYFTVAHCGVLRGLPLSPFSWFVLCRMTKNEHTVFASACRRHRVSAERKSRKKLSHPDAKA